MEQKPLSTRLTNSIIKYVEHRGGDVTALLDGIPFDRAYLTSTDKWVPTAIQTMLIERAELILGEENVARNEGRFSVTPKILGLISVMARMFTDPSKLYAKSGDYVRYFNRLQQGRSTMIGKNECIIEISHAELDGYSYCGCEIAAGVFESVPTVFGLPYATVKKETCALPIGKAGKVHGLYYNVDEQGSVEAFFDEAHTRSAGAKGRLEKDGSFVVDDIKFGAECCRYHISFPEMKGMYRKIRDLIFSRLIDSRTNYIEELEQANITLEEQFDELKHKELQLTRQKELSMALIQQQTLEEVLSLVANSIIEIGDALVCMIYLVKEDNSIRYVQGGYAISNKNQNNKLRNFMPDSNLQPENLDLSMHPQIMEILSEGKHHMISDIGRFMSMFWPSELFEAAKKAIGLQQAILFPLIVRKEPFGIIVVVSKKDLDVESLEPIVNMAAQAIWNQRRNEEIRQSRDNLDTLVIVRTAELEETNKELKQTQAFIIRQEKMASVGQLAAGVAHEINNPLGYIQSNLNTLRTYMVDIKKYFERTQPLIENSLKSDGELARKEAEQAEGTVNEVYIKEIIDDIEPLLSECMEGTKRATSIVASLKDFSRPGENKPALADINKGIESTLAVIWNELKYHAKVHKELGDLPLIPCYPQELNQVVLNLVLNAAHSLKNQGNIWVRSRTRNGSIEIEVEDDGEGIPPENLSRIFDPFFTTKPVGKGTGLGLTISYGIVKKHNGEMLVDSEPGRGSKFTVSIPRDEIELEDNYKEEV